MLKAKLKSDKEEILEVKIENKKITVEVESISKAMEFLPIFSDFKSSIIEPLKDSGFDVRLKKSFLELDL